MVVGVISWELHLAGCGSLKEKRGILRSLKARLQDRHKVSVAETNHQNVWQRAEISAAVVCSDRRRAQAIVQRIDTFVASEARVRVIDSFVIYY